jgi:hypothetical protein
MRRVLVLLVLSSVPAVANGQTCLGNTAYTPGAIKAAAGLEIGEATGIWGGAGIGRARGWFAGASAGFLSADDETLLGIGVGGGLELKKPLADRLELCPMAGIRKYFGDFGFTDFIAAVAASYGLGSESAGTRWMLVGGYEGIYQRYGDGFHEWYGNLDLGIGAIFNQRISVVPQIRIPVRFSGGKDISFMVRASLNLGN